MLSSDSYFFQELSFLACYVWELQCIASQTGGLLNEPCKNGGSSKDTMDTSKSLGDPRSFRALPLLKPGCLMSLR